MILISILYLFWSALLFMNKEIMFHCSHPFFIGGLRSFSAGVLLIGYSYFVKGSRLKYNDLSRKEWKKLLISSFMLYSLAISGFSLGLDYISPIVISFVYSSGPFLTAGLMYFLYGQTLSKKKLIGLLIGFVGVIMIVLGGDEVATASSSLSGAAIYLISMLLLSYSWILLKDIIKSRRETSLLLNGISMTFGGSIALTCSLLFKVPDDSMKLLFINHTLLVATFIGLTAFCYGLYAYLLTKYSATFLSFAAFLDPIFGVLIGVCFFGRPFHFVFITSFVLLFIGLYLFYKEELKLS